MAKYKDSIVNYDCSALVRLTTKPGRVANSLLSQELKLCFSDTKCTKAPYTKKDTRFFIDTK